MRYPCFLLILVLTLLPSVARAEGPLSGGTRVYIADEPVGPFTVTSFAAPNPPVTTDRLWVTVQVRDGIKAVADARVWLTVTFEGDDPPQRLEATHELAPTPFDYTAAFPVPETGNYQVGVEIEHPQGSGTVAYPVSVSEPLTRWILLVMALPALVVALVLARRFGLRLPQSAAVLAGDDEPLRMEERAGNPK